MQTLVIITLVMLYCAVQLVRDVRRRSYGMALLDMACIIALALVPIPTHVVKVDLPLATAK